MANARPKTFINVKHRYNGTLGVDAVLTDFFLKLQIDKVSFGWYNKEMKGFSCGFGKECKK